MRSSILPTRYSDFDLSFIPHPMTGDITVLKNEEAIFPYKYPALFSVTAAFVSIWFFSITDRSENARKEREAFEAQNVRSQTGIGAEGAVEH